MDRSSGQEPRNRNCPTTKRDKILQFHKNTKLAKRHESLEVVRAGPESLVARKKTGGEVSISPKQTRAFSGYDRHPIEIAVGDSLMLTANRQAPEFRATNGDLVKVNLWIAVPFASTTEEHSLRTITNSPTDMPSRPIEPGQVSAPRSSRES
jgi:hypothetical protein